MPRISIRGNTLYYREPEHTEVVGVVDGQGDLSPHSISCALDRLPKSAQGEAKSMLREIWGADTRERAKEALTRFLATWEAKYPKAAECLARDREELLAFYDFPAAHWQSLRTTNPIESVQMLRRRSFIVWRCPYTNESPRRV